MRETSGSRGVVVISINTSWNVINFRSNLVLALIAHGYEVVAVCPPDDYSPRIEALGCRFIPLPMDTRGTSLSRDLLLFARYVRIMRALRPAAFLGFTIKPNIYGSIAAQMAGAVTINNISGLGAAFVRETWLTRLVSAMYRLSLARAGKVFFQNAEDRALCVARGLVDDGKCGLLPGSGVDLARFTPPEDAPREDSSPRFLLICRMIWDKGVGEYVEAARAVRRRYPKAIFRIVGIMVPDMPGAVDTASLDSWVAEGIVEFLGALDDVRPAIADVDCVVLPTYYREGTPRTLLEASAMARPIITTDEPGCRDVVEDGATGFLCRSRDAGDLARAMLNLGDMSLADRKAMGLAGRAMIEARYDDKIVIRAYLDALKEARQDS